MIINCLNCSKERTVYKSSSAKYCCKECQLAFEQKKYIEDWKNGLVDGSNGILSKQTTRYIRRYIRDKFNDTCAECGQGNMHNGKPLTLQLEHIDGNNENNKEENLSWLCPNCHTQTKYYGSRNQGIEEKVEDLKGKNAGLAYWLCPSLPS